MSPPDRPRPRRRWPTVLALLVGTFLASLDVTVVGTAMPRIVAELRGLALYPAVFSAYLLSSTVTVPIYGKLADLVGRRPTWLLGVFFFLVGSAACGAATSMPLLIAARTVQGIGAGAVLPVTMTIFGDLFDVTERARVQGVFALVWGVSSVLGPLVGGFFVESWSWRWVFWINLPIGFVAAAILLLSFREQVVRRAVRIDVPGVLLLVSGLSALLAGAGGWTSPWALLAGGLLLLALVPVERRAREPVFAPALLAEPTLVFGALASTLFGAVLFSYVAYVPLYLQGVTGFDPLSAGLLVSPVSAAWTSVTFLVGRFILRHGYRRVVRAGAAAIALATLATSVAAHRHRGDAVDLVFYVAGQLLLGAGMGATSASLLIVVQDRMAWAQRGAATAFMQLCRQVGATLGTAALGLVLVRLLATRLATVERAPAAEVLVDPSKWSGIDPAVLAPSIAALAHALSRVSRAVVAAGALSVVVAWYFPDVRVDPDASLPPPGTD